MLMQIVVPDPRRIILITLVLLAIAYGFIQGDEQKSEDEPQQIIFAWLECEECFDGELEAVLDLGEIAIPVLFDILENGPPPQNINDARESLTSDYDQVVIYLENKKREDIVINQTMDEYVEFYLENLEAQYKSRAFLALKESEGTNLLFQAQKLVAVAIETTSRADLKLMLEALLQPTNRQ